MAENLKTTKYQNGVIIPNITSATAWSSLSTGAYCYKNNISALGVIYGNLYNWFATADSNDLCPVGWHIPSDAEWDTLITYFGGTAIAGASLKEKCTNYWISPNTGATNESGFSALPGDFRLNTGYFSSISGQTSYWWSSTEAYTTMARVWSVYNDQIDVGWNANDKKGGSSVRCIKNQ
jgi:uncharacterized protein (TIGR02145 family)